MSLLIFLTFVRVPVILSLSVGEVIDKTERSYYGFFSDVENFQSARVYKIEKNLYEIVIYTEKDSIILKQDSLYIQFLREYIDFFEERKQDPFLEQSFNERWEKIFAKYKVSKKEPDTIKIKPEIEIIEEKPEKTVFEIRTEEKLLTPLDPLSKVIDFDSIGSPITEFEMNAVRGSAGRTGGIIGGIVLGLIVSAHPFLSAIFSAILVGEPQSANPPLAIFIYPLIGGVLGFEAGKSIDNTFAIKKIKELRKKNQIFSPELMEIVDYDKENYPVLRAEIEARKGFGFRGWIGVPSIILSFPLLFIPGIVGFSLSNFIDTEMAKSLCRKKFGKFRTKTGLPIYLKEIYYPEIKPQSEKEMK